MTFSEPGTPSDLTARVRATFREVHGTEPEVVGRAPGRVNLIGEHTDYNAGLCLPVALPHATYAALRPRADDVVTVASGQQRDPWRGTLATSGPGGPQGWAAYVAGVVWAMREAGHDVPGLDIVVEGTVPLGAGLSSSAALECSVAVAVTRVLGLELTDALRRALVAACMRAESEVAGAPTGGMDQSVALLAHDGAALLIDFADHSTEAVDLPLAASGLTLLVTDTRVSHALGDGGYAARRADCESAAAALGLDSLREATPADLDRLHDERIRRRARHVVTEIDRVRATVTALRAADWAGLGRLFGDSHLSMRDDFEISCPELDTAVVTALEAGAVGARMTGGGFGGSTVAVVPTTRVDAVVRAIDAAFVSNGFGPPAHLLAEPSGRADLQ